MSGWTNEEVTEAALAAHADACDRAAHLRKSVDVVAGRAGGQPTDDEQSAKSWLSIADKLGRRGYLARRHSAETVAHSLEDLARFTVLFRNRAYWMGVRTLVDALDEAQLPVGRINNFWLVSPRRYAGVHLYPRDPLGREFEIQVHTPSSHQWREASHGVYEARRRLKSPSPKADALDQKLTEGCMHATSIPAGDPNIGRPMPPPRLN